MRADDATAGRRIPVVLVTGFLGSGKTTLVNHLLRSAAFARAAVVVSEYGEAGIDHLLIEAPRPRTRLIDGGCLCGHVHEEVASSLLDLHHQRAAAGEQGFDRVLIETSGLADPVPIVQILLTDAALAGLYELRTVLTVADGLYGVQHLAEHAESVKQAAIADLLVLGKTDLAGPDALDRLGGALAGINPAARQIRASHGRLDPALVLEDRGFAPSAAGERADRWLGERASAAAARPAGADPAIATFTLEYGEEITLPGFVLWMNLLAGFRGAGLLRVKGIVNVEGKPYAVQAVQTVISEPVPLARWPDGDRRSRLVFITRHMDAADLRRTFGAFRFDAGRQPRNMVISPDNYAKFKQAIAPFRAAPPRAASADAPQSHRNLGAGEQAP